MFYYTIEHLFPYTGWVGKTMKSVVSKTALPSEVSKAIDEYTPQRVSETVWAGHGHLVADRVRAASPQGAENARRLLSAGAGLLAFVERNQIPLDPDVVFSDEVIERYVATALGGSQASNATVRGRLRRLRDATSPKLSPQLGHTRVRPPYTTEELAGLWRVISNQPRERRTRRLQGLYCLCLGAGCDSRDLRTVSGEHVYSDNGVVYVAIGGLNSRTVPVFSGLGSKLLSLAEGAGEKLIIDGNPHAQNPINTLVGSATGGEDLPKLNVSRLRHSWMVAMMRARIPLAVLTQYAGFSSLRTLEDLIPYAEVPSGTIAFDSLIAEAMETPWL